MNQRACRRHAFLDGRCFLCGAGDEHRHCYGEYHVCAWYEPTEHDAPRKASR